MKFKSQKDILFTSVMLGLNLFLIGMTFSGFITGNKDLQDYFFMLLMLGVVGLLFWFYFGTNYQLSKDKLLYRCGPIKGEINIDSINQIIKGKTLWVGMKPATSRKGLIIKYNKYDEIYISPTTNESFIKRILELKSDIKITE